MTRCCTWVTARAGSSSPWLRDGAVVAGMNVNVWDVSDDIQALIRSGKKVDPARLTDPDIPVAEV